MQTEQIQFGYRTSNRLVRVFQVLFVPFFLGLAGDPHSPSFWLFGVLLIGFEFYGSFIVFATLGEDGLIYERWRKPIRVDWDSFQIPKQRWAFFILIKLHEKPFWNRYLLLPSPRPSLHELALSSRAAKRLEDLVLAHRSGRTN
jgi:hypothetical protein